MSLFVYVHEYTHALVRLYISVCLCMLVLSNVYIV